MALALTISQTFSQVTDAEKQLRTRTDEDSTYWKFGGFTSLVFNQAYFKNWAQGGVQSIATTGLLNATAFYRKGKNAWDNTLDLTYGTIQKGEDGDWEKSDDKIELTSKYGRVAYKNWYYAALLNFKTQFSVGYDYTTDTSKISNFMAPAYLIGAIGMDYNPNEHFSAFITPISARYTFVLDQELADKGAYGVDPAVFDENGVMLEEGATYRNEVGGYMRMATNFDIMKNVNFSSNLNLFSNYLENAQNIDVDWEVLLTFKVNEYLGATLKTQMIYDDDIKIAIDDDGDGVAEKEGPRLQFKEMFGLALTYRFK